MELSGWIAPSGEFYPTTPDEPSSRLALLLYGPQATTWYLTTHGWLWLFSTGEIRCYDFAQVTEAQVAAVRGFVSTAGINQCRYGALTGFLTAVRHSRHATARGEA
jgi:hypothetical protein